MLSFGKWVSREEGTLKDEWGLTWKRIGRYNEFVNPPLAGAGIADVMRFPDSTDAGRYRGVREEAERPFRDTTYAVVGNLTG
jgi:hypothetical protein